jgi:phosphonate transport system substrate-binding protein
MFAFVGDPRPEERSEEPTRLCVGIALTTDPSTAQRLLDEFCLALAESTGLEVVPRGVWHYHHLLEGLADREIDIVWLPPILALRATANGRVVPIALPVRRGVSAYRSALFARADSTLRTMADLKGVRAAWVDRQSAAGYLIIRAHLAAQGLQLDEAFASETFLGTYDGVAGAVMDGDADVGATYVYLDEQPGQPPLIRKAGWEDREVHMIAYSGPIPSDIIAADRRLPAKLRSVVQAALVEAGNHRLQQAARAMLSADSFVAPTAEHLDPLTKLLGRLLDASNTPHSMFPPPPKKE